MSDKRIKLTRAVAYHTHQDGQISIRLLVPWDGKPRFPSFPMNIRLRIHAEDAILRHSYEETQRLDAARAISSDVAAAVKDDILCTRAAALMVKQAREIRQSNAELRAVDSLYEDWVDPAWLRKLRNKFKKQEHAQEQTQ